MEDKLYQDVRFELKDLKRALLVGAYFSTRDQQSCLDHLDELGALGTTYGFEIVEKIACPIKKIESKTFIGKGKVEELSKIDADVVVFDENLSPNQERNLEKLLGKPVIDRTELILEVFAQRAHTKEAMLQIELAKSSYQLPRLRRLWTHLSRQSGSGGGAHLKGEGERQIELDKRMIRKRITRLRHELEEVRKQREIQRHARLRRAVPTFAIVGYTNVGKSTLLNSLTQAGILVEDKLFATLDTTTRKFTLPNQQECLLIDTVGFIRKIPHTLVAAFKSTLEEAVYTDILLHLIDITNPMAEEQAEATCDVLKELGAEDRPIITVLNKMDACTNRLLVQKFRMKYPKVVPISAKDGEGFDELLEVMTVELAKLRTIHTLRIPQSEYALISEVMEKGNILETEYEGNDVVLKAEVPSVMHHKLEQYIQ